MTQLFMSYVCNFCQPPTQTESSSSSECVPDKWYTCSSKAGLDKVSRGYKLYKDLTYVFNKCTQKSKIAGGPYFIYEITEPGEDYADFEAVVPLCTRSISVNIHTVVP
jgi:hypothetical protein